MRGNNYQNNFHHLHIGQSGSFGTFLFENVIITKIKRGLISFVKIKWFFTIESAHRCRKKITPTTVKHRPTQNTAESRRPGGPLLKVLRVASGELCALTSREVQ